MSAIFAGSARVDDRRRRRLAQEMSDQSVDEDAPGISRPSRTSLRIDPGEARPSRRQVLVSLPVLIPEQSWKLVLAALVALLPGFALIGGTQHAEDLAAHLGPGVQRLFGSQSVPLLRWYESLLALAGANLSLVIFWVRSRSHRDFSGRYRIWVPVALACVALASGLVTDVHLALSDIARHFIQVRFWQDETVLWLGPAALAGIALAIRLRGEMRACRGSSVTLLLCGVCYWAAGLRILDVLTISDPFWNRWLLDVLLLAGCGWLLLSLLLQARHVVHRSAEPAPTPVRSIGIPRPHFRWPFRRKTVENESNHTDVSPSRRTRGKRPPRRGKTGPTESDAALDETAEPATPDDANEHGPICEPIGSEPPRKIPPAPFFGPDRNPKPVRDSVAEDRSARPLGHERPEPESYGDSTTDDSDEECSDDPGDHPELRGLSRKQRRKMLKQMRQQQRTR